MRPGLSGMRSSVLSTPCVIAASAVLLDDHNHTIPDCCLSMIAQIKTDDQCV